MAKTPAKSQAPSQTQPQSTLQLPSPQTFDILPALHELLARIDHNGASTNAASAAAANLLDDTSPDEIGALYTELTPLDPKDLLREVLPLKAKIRRAVEEVGRLPDVERSIGEQEEEIGELEARIQRLRATIGRLEGVARAVEGRVG